MIAVVGEALIDAFVDGDVLRPYAGGGPFNTAVALARLGTPVTFVSGFSTDRLGELLRTTLLDAGVMLDAHQAVDAPSPLAIVDARAGGDAEYRFYLTDTAFEALAQELRPPGDGTAAVLVGSLALALDPPGGAVAQFAKEASEGTLVVVDPNVRPRLITERAAFLRRFESVVTVAGIVRLSRNDAEWLYPGLSADGLARRLLEAGAGCVVATDGALGATAWTEAETVQVPAPYVDVIDTVGAGDAFTAGLISWLWENEQLDRAGVGSLGAAELVPALSWAAAAGASQCSRASAWGPTRTDVINVLQAAARDAAQPRSGG